MAKFIYRDLKVHEPLGIEKCCGRTPLVISENAAALAEWESNSGRVFTVVCRSCSRSLSLLRLEDDDALERIVGYWGERKKETQG